MFDYSSWIVMKIMNNVKAKDYRLTLFYISLKIYSWSLHLPMRG